MSFCALGVFMKAMRFTKMDVAMFYSGGEYMGMRRRFGEIPLENMIKRKIIKAWDVISPHGPIPLAGLSDYGYKIKKVLDKLRAYDFIGLYK